MEQLERDKGVDSQLILKNKGKESLWCQALWKENDVMRNKEEKRSSSHQATLPAIRLEGLKQE